MYIYNIYNYVLLLYICIVVIYCYISYIHMLLAAKSKCTHAVFSRNVPYSKTKAKETNPRNLPEGETFTIRASQHWSCHPNPHACRVEAQQLTQGIMSRGIRKYSKEGNVYDSRFTIIRSLCGKNPVKNLGKTDVSLGPSQFKSCSQTSLRASASLLCVTGFFKKISHPLETAEILCLPPQPPTSML